MTEKKRMSTMADQLKGLIAKGLQLRNDSETTASAERSEATADAVPEPTDARVQTPRSPNRVPKVPISAARPAADRRKKRRRRGPRRDMQPGDQGAQAATIEVMRNGVTVIRQGPPRERVNRRPQAMGRPAVEQHDEISVTFSASPKLNPLFLAAASTDVKRIKTRSDGRRLQAPCHAGGAMPARDMVLAIDFGTSATKVVVRDSVADSGRGVSYAVPFFDGANVQRYLQPSHIAWLQDPYSLDLVAGGQCSRDLKLKLLAGNTGDEDHADVVGFLACVMRHARAWLFDLRGEELARARLQWKVVLGLPAADFGNQALRERYLRLACSAAVLSVVPDEISRSTASRAWQSVKQPMLERSAESAGQAVEVIPEIVAQVSGYVRSQFFNRAADPMMMVIDVGAGTLDAAVFNLVMRSGRQHIYAFGCSVEQHGAVMLHRHRVAQLMRGIDSREANGALGEKLLRSVEKPTDLRRLPDVASTYLTGMRVVPGDKAIDTPFLSRMGAQLFERTIVPAKRRNPANLAWQKLPVFLCGGGSALPFYRDYPATVFNRGATAVKLDVKPMPIPNDFLAGGLDAIAYHRMSVAYGLSVHRLGDYVRPDEIDEIQVRGDGAAPVMDIGDNDD